LVPSGHGLAHVVEQGLDLSLEAQRVLRLVVQSRQLAGE
jgi:hypothetical protein